MTMSRSERRWHRITLTAWFSVFVTAAGATFANWPRSLMTYSLLVAALAGPIAAEMYGRRTASPCPTCNSTQEAE